MPDLKNCPFCGEEATAYHPTGCVGIDMRKAWCVGCSRCRIGHEADTRAEAVALWNRRAPSPEVRAVVEAAEKWVLFVNDAMGDEWSVEEIGLRAAIDALATKAYPKEIEA